MHHPHLRNDDIIILSTSKIQHIEDSLDNLQKRPLEAYVAAELDALYTDEMQRLGVDMIDARQW